MTDRPLSFQGGHPRQRHQAQGAATGWAPDISLAEMRSNLAWNGPELYVGADSRGLVWAGPQQALLALGPPRSGKTSAIVLPNVLAAPGPLVVTSTKRDVLDWTLPSRAQLGRCWILDPSGSMTAPPGATALRWSPVEASLSWEEALASARVMVATARPHGSYGESAHWTERAEALLAPMFHAAAGAGGDMSQVLSWVLRHDLNTPMAELAHHGGPAAQLAVEVLAGIADTEERERSGILSTAAGALAAYRSQRALQMAQGPNFDPSRFPATSDTVYICAPARYQALVAPVVVAFLEQVRAATYRAAANGCLRLPVSFVLDEVANVAPLPDLPAMVSEGGGQGLLTMACLQDLSQARGRWGQAADGFFSLFGTKVLLGGIGDMKTLEAVSRLAGQVDVPVRSVNRSAWWSGRPSASTTYSWRRQARLPVDQAHSLPAGSALVIAGARPPRPVALTPWWGYRPFSDARLAPAPSVWPLPSGCEVAERAQKEREAQALAALGSHVPPPRAAATAPGQVGPPVKWQRVPGQRRLHPPPPQL
ncbi:MAG TPA: type IV secretory system conjugative DNA transfer family protein [Acidimicrobiales bacterium]|nr:type IV secretory system conjugative DNA transfer family protein [Acidimicrobiales bacterium]